MYLDAIEYVDSQVEILKRLKDDRWNLTSGIPAGISQLLS